MENRMNQDWLIKNIPVQTRLKIKKYAKDNGYTIAGAIKALVEKGLK